MKDKHSYHYKVDAEAKLLEAGYTPNPNGTSYHLGETTKVIKPGSEGWEIITTDTFKMEN